MSGKIPGSALSLKQFMVQRQVLSLYRDILRTIRRVPQPNDRQQLLTWAQHDFRANAKQTDENTIKALIFHGQRTLKEMQQSLELSK